MKKNKIIIEAAIVLIVSLVLVLPSSAIITNTSEEMKTMDFKEIEEQIKMGKIDLPKTMESPKKITFPSIPLALDTDFPLIDLPDYNCQNPTLAISNNQNNFALFFEFSEGIGDSNVGVMSSNDGGETWSESFYSFDWEGYVELPDVDYVGNIEGKDFFSGAAIEIDGQCMLMNIADIEDIENTLTGSSYDWSDNGFYDITSCEIACSDEILSGDEYYVMAYIASFTDVGSYPDCDALPHYLVDKGGGSGSCYWFYYNYSSNSRIDIDKTADIVYYAFEAENGTNKDVILLSSELEYVGEVEPAGWGDGHGDGRKRMIGGSANVINPDISAENNYVYLLAETDQAGNQDIICYYSSDSGDTYDMSIIADSVDDEQFPEIYADGINAVCVFTKDNNLYSAKTEDGGVTWEISEVINDVDGSVVEQLAALDIYNDKTVWSDDRGGYGAIYMDKVSATPQPLLTLSEISGGIGTSLTITNEGEAPATNVEWSISIEGTIFLGSEASDTITSLAVGASETIKTGFPLGLGAIEITATATCDEGSSDTSTGSGKLLLFFIIMD